MGKEGVGMRGGYTSTGRQPTARQLQAEVRRQQILETALKLFAAQGFDGTSTRQIAKGAGIAEGLIFHYFRTKLRPLLEDAGGKPAPEVLRTVASGWLATLRRDDAFVIVLFATAQTNPEVRQAWQG